MIHLYNQILVKFFSITSFYWLVSATIIGICRWQGWPDQFLPDLSTVGLVSYVLGVSTTMQQKPQGIIKEFSKSNIEFILHMISIVLVIELTNLFIVAGLSNLGIFPQGAYGLGVLHVDTIWQLSLVLTATIYLFFLDPLEGQNIAGSFKKTVVILTVVYALLGFTSLVFLLSRVLAYFLLFTFLFYALFMSTNYQSKLFTKSQNRKHFLISTVLVALLASINILVFRSIGYGKNSIIGLFGEEAKQPAKVGKIDNLEGLLNWIEYSSDPDPKEVQKAIGRLKEYCPNAPRDNAKKVTCKFGPDRESKRKLKINLSREILNFLLSGSDEYSKLFATIGLRAYLPLVEKERALLEKVAEVPGPLSSAAHHTLSLKECEGDCKFHTLYFVQE